MVARRGHQPISKVGTSGAVQMHPHIGGERQRRHCKTSFWVSVLYGFAAVSCWESSMVPLEIFLSSAVSFNNNRVPNKSLLAFFLEPKLYPARVDPKRTRHCLETMHIRTFTRLAMKHVRRKDYTTTEINQD